LSSLSPTSRRPQARPCKPASLASTGFYNLTYRCAFKFVGGLWSASFAINGTNIFTDTPCPYMTLADSRFYHGFSGTPVGNITDRKRLTRYYMKLTYL